MIDDVRTSRLRRLPWCGEGALPIGVAPALTVRGGEVALWALTAGEAVLRCGRPQAIGVTAAQTADLADRVVIAGLPWLDREPRNPRWTAQVVTRIRPCPEALLLEGGSLGLTMVLALASRWLEVPVASDLLCTGAISQEGEVLPVGGLSAKLSLLDVLPAIRQVLVPAGQVAEARALAPARVDIVGVARIADAIEVALPGIQEAFEQRVAQSADRQAMARRLLLLALGGSPRLISWTAVATAAVRTAQVCDDESVRWEAEVAEAIASRHEARVEALIDLDCGSARLPEPLWLRLLAHAVQQANDAGSVLGDRPALEAVVDRHTPRPPEFAEALVLAGAVGRWLASSGSLDPAIDVLSEAVAGWEALGRLADASHAACALAHALALAGRWDVDADELLARIEAEDAPTAPPAFLRVARARAWWVAGEDARVACLLDDDVPWWSVSAHLRAARLRLLGHVDPEGPHRPQLAALAVSEPAAAADQLHLLDAWSAERRGADPSPQLDALSATDEGRRQLDRLRRLHPRATAATLAARYPY